MGASVGPFDALAGLISGYTESRDADRARARQARLDREASTDREDARKLARSNASVARAKTIAEEGLIPDDGRMAPGDLLPTDFNAKTFSEALTSTPDMRPEEAGPFGALVNAFNRTKAAPRVSILNPEGQSETFRMGTPLRILQERETQQQIDARAAAKQAADEKRALDLEGQRTKDADAKEQRENEEAFGTFKAAYPQNQFAKQFNPKMKYKPLLDRLDRMAERQMTIDAAKANAPLVPVAMPDGSTQYMTREEARGMKVGKAGGTAGGATKALAAPIAAKVGQAGEMLKKADDVLKLTEDLDVTLGKSAARDISEHGFAHIPGSKGVGSMLMARSPAYAQYQAALSPFILAAAHALSGARINQDQVEQIRKSVELAPGDFSNASVRAQKKKNLIDLINSINGSLPKEAIAEQEGQMDEDALGRIAGHGYKRVGSKADTTGKKTVTVNGKTFVLPDGS